MLGWTETHVPGERLTCADFMPSLSGQWSYRIIRVCGSQGPLFSMAGHSGCGQVSV